MSERKKQITQATSHDADAVGQPKGQIAAKVITTHNPVAIDGGCVVIRLRQQLRALAADIRRSGRDYPIACLTSRAGQNEPALSAVILREVLGEDAAIYFVRTGHLTHKLQELLPYGLHVYDGAIRIWWPEVDDRSDPKDHPLIFAAENSTEKLLQKVTQTRPSSLMQLDQFRVAHQKARNRRSSHPRISLESGIR